MVCLQRKKRIWRETPSRSSKPRSMRYWREQLLEAIKICVLVAITNTYQNSLFSQYDRAGMLLRTNTNQHNYLFPTRNGDWDYFWHESWLEQASTFIFERINNLWIQAHRFSWLVRYNWIFAYSSKNDPPICIS